MSGLGLLTDYNNDSEASESEDKTGTSMEQKSKVNIIAIFYSTIHHLCVAKFHIVLNFIRVKSARYSEFCCFTAFLGSMKFTPILFLCLKPIQVGDIIQTINRKR